MVLDMSSNGTFVRFKWYHGCNLPRVLTKQQINGEKIGKGRYGVLREGNEIAFGGAAAE